MQSHEGYSPFNAFADRVLAVTTTNYPNPPRQQQDALPALLRAGARAQPALNGLMTGIAAKATAAGASVEWVAAPVKKPFRIMEKVVQGGGARWCWCEIWTR